MSKDKNNAYNGKLVWIFPVLVGSVVLILLFAAFQKGYLLDHQSPEVSIISPTDMDEVILAQGATFREFIQINAKDNAGISKIELLENGTVIHSTQGKNLTQYEWKTKEAGKYSFQAVAYDHCDNASKSTPVIIRIKEKEEAPPAPKVVVPPSNPTPHTSAPVHSVSAGEEVDQVERVEQVLYQWVDSVPAKDLKAHLDCYAEHLERYFNATNWTKRDIYAGKEEMMIKYDYIEMYISDIQITLVDSNHAVAIFTKGWDARGQETFAGEETQRLKFTKINGSWKITSEEELEIFWVERNGKKVV